MAEKSSPLVSAKLSWNEYDSRDAITGERVPALYLQIDHRVPYDVGGETAAHSEASLEEYMLLDASSQRRKSWECEQCSVWLEKQGEGIFRSCYWAFPENYTHVAGEPIRRADVEWRGSEVEAFEKLRIRAEREGTTVSTLLKRLSEGQEIPSFSVFEDHARNWIAKAWCDVKAFYSFLMAT